MPRAQGRPGAGWHRGPLCAKCAGIDAQRHTGQPGHSGLPCAGENKDAYGRAEKRVDSDGKGVMIFFQAQDAAKRWARGDHGTGDNAPVTVDGALTAYEADLKARSSNPYNAQWPRVHLSSVLLGKPIALLTSNELQ